MKATDHPQPRCPECNWFLKFVWQATELRWFGYCWNPSCVQGGIWPDDPPGRYWSGGEGEAEWAVEDEGPDWVKLDPASYRGGGVMGRRHGH